MTIRVCNETSAYVNCRLSDVSHFYLTASPSRDLTLKASQSAGVPTTTDYIAQTGSIIDQLKQILLEYGLQSRVIMMNVFMADISMKQLVRWMFREYFDMTQAPIITPVTNYVHQRPADGSLLTVAVYALGGEAVRIGLAYREESITVEFNQIKFCVLGDITPSEEPIGAYDRSLWAFRRIRRVLESRNFGVENLIRTWIYQGNLTHKEGDVQRYMELNRARATFFEEAGVFCEANPYGPHGTRFPASTGIGADGMDVIMSAFACKTTRDDVQIVSLENPHQTAAYDYREEYSPKSPKFSRATACVFDGLCQIYVSGTASIVDSESKHLDDPAAQTHQTLDNIANLIAEANLLRHGIEGHNPKLSDVACMRVYIKNQADYEIIRDICTRRAENVPVIYTIADVCRPELLVEIECVVCARRTMQFNTREK